MAENENNAAPEVRYFYWVGYTLNYPGSDEIAFSGMEASTPEPVAVGDLWLLQESIADQRTDARGKPKATVISVFPLAPRREG